MISFGNIEVRLGLILAVSAFILSPLIGIVSGISFVVVLIRTVIMSALFFGLGFGAMVLVKKFVPEFYEVLSTSAPAPEQNPEEIDTGVEAIAGEVDTEGEGEFDESGEPDDSSYDPGYEPIGESGTGAAKMGRHILEEQGLKYEPKIMAEAIRTMMSRDED